MPSVPINVSASGDNALNIAVAGKILRVRGWILAGASAVNVTLKNGSTPVTGPIPVASPNVAPLDSVGEGWFNCTQGNDVTVNLSAAVQVSGLLVYDLVG